LISTGVAQLVEHWSPKPAVGSSSLSSRARKRIKVEKLKIYLRDVFVELKERTTWPTFKQLQKDSLLVLGASIAFALVIKIMNIAFEFIMDFIYDL
tara:strand:+ start:72 stop:359 length:288 start_codon:yes stop_codon:yes gene_type:complete